MLLCQANSSKFVIVRIYKYVSQSLSLLGISLVVTVTKTNFRFFSGIGVVLVTAAGLAWRLGSRDTPCALLGLRRASCRRLVPRLPPSYARPHHPYAAMLYPEFHYRPPPPTYQASMHEYRLRLVPIVYFQFLQQINLICDIKHSHCLHSYQNLNIS